jgi:two-component system cell cycle sensor histidine kinase/response regulator CckA
MSPACRVLVIDDDDFVRDVTTMSLEDLGYRVRATGDGFEALRWLEDEAFDLLVVDVKMSEIDGPTLYREVRERWPERSARVLFVSGFGETDYHEPALQAVRDVPLLFKPFSLDDLKAAIERVLTPA